LVDAARETRVLEVRGGLLEGRPIEASEIDALAKLPPLDALRSQVLAAVIGPVTGIVALFTAPLQDLYGLIDARIEQLEAQGDTSGTQASGSEPRSDQPAEEPAGEAEPEAAGEASGSEAQAEAEPAEPETETETTEEDQ
jgi:large subunit ribosomal protein L10